MKIVLMSMPDVAAVIMHESAFHMPNNGIASIGANVDPGHEVTIIDLIRKRRRVRRYVTETLLKIRPDVVGLSAMAWQYRTCTKLARLIRRLLPGAKIVIGGYHATLMFEEIAASPESALIDFIVRGEGEEAFRRLINALDGKDRFEEIPSLSYKNGHGFVHNPRGELLDLSKLKLPIRDKRRLTWGYHIMNDKVEVIETSRGCTRTCNFCSMNHMYGRTFRPFPMERIMADIEDIYYNRKTRWIFVADDNLVLDPDRVLALCDAIIARKFRGLNFVVQADCITMSRNEEMVRKMARAGFKTVFLGIENVSKKNLKAAGKGNIVEASRKAVAICHKYGIMVVAGMIFGFPDDDEEDIIENYRFLKEIEGGHLLLPDPDALPEDRHAPVPVGRGAGHQRGRLHALQRDVGQCQDPSPERRGSAVPGLVPPAEGDGVVGALGAGAQTGPVVDGDLGLFFQTVPESLPGEKPPETRLAGPLREAFCAHPGGEPVPRP